MTWPGVPICAGTPPFDFLELELSDWSLGVVLCPPRPNVSSIGCAFVMIYDLCIYTFRLMPREAM